MAQVRYRVSNVSLGFMLALAVVFDLLQFLLTLTVVGALFTLLFGFVGFIIYAIWFLILGVNYIQGRKAAAKLGTLIATWVVEFMPLLNALPSMTVGVLLIALISRAEDRATFKEEQEAVAQEAKWMQRVR